jgi:KAP-like P-loop domain-containing protein
MDQVAKLKSSVVNFSQFQLESHVEKALQAAWSVSGRKVISAGDLLKGALLGYKTSPSSAFRKLGALLPAISLPTMTVGAPLDLAATPVTPELAASFSVAEAFLKEGNNRVWGRDYVTLALLSKANLSLVFVVVPAGWSIERIRREWYDFVRSSDHRRKPDSWTRWWRAAGLAPPEGNANTVSSPSAAYVFTWNPGRFPFPDLDSHISEIKTSGSTLIRWSTGNRRTLSRGDRVYMIRQGDEQRGLVGVGEVEGDVIEAPHWDAEERKLGRTSSLVDVRWSAFDREPILDLSTLIRETGESEIWSSQSGGVSLKPDAARKLDAAWPSAWERRLQGLRDDSLPDAELKHWIARFDADTGKRADRLKVDRYVNAFARVMASRALTPPLSIGLFGDWGSGKTFFMDRLYDKIQELSQTSAADPPLYWGRICQIRFNAWHYTETNLWASLVTTIFNELSNFLDPPETDKEQFNRLLNQLEVVQALRKEAVEKLDDAVKQLKLATDKVVEAQNALAKMGTPPQPTDAELRKILLDKLVSRLPSDAQSLAELLEDAGRWSGRADFDLAAAQVRQGKVTVGEAQKLLADAGVLASHAGFWWRILSAAHLHKTVGFWIVVGLLIAIPFVLPTALVQFMSEGWAHAWALVGEIFTVVGASITWMRSRMASAGSVFDRLASVRTDIEREIEAARSRDRIAFEAERDAAIGKEKAARERMEQAKLEEARAAEVERKARDALRDSTSQARLGRFIRERTSSADYERHLGLIAMIHRDFEKLSRLMVSVREQNADPDLPRIDRIVLYIDDLDRCHPPDKVVRVLEAVHLLLFFPLFVVVVGVDSRWVSRALYKHYEGMLADEAISPNQANGLQRPPAESQDFLEKIFQVPFWLRRMDPTAVQRLLHQLITPAEVESESTPPPETPAEDTTRPVGANESAGPPAAGMSTPADAALSATKRTTAEAEIDEETADSLTTPSESLRITDRELQFMDRVAPLMPRTPRSIKRFVNIYRLYKAALAPEAFARFTGTQERPGNFRAVQVLLALVTGVPHFAQQVFSALHVSENPTSPEKLLALVSRIEQKTADTQILDDEETRSTLEALREFSLKESLELSELRDVASLVSRYSVHHMISKAPGEAGLG